MRPSRWLTLLALALLTVGCAGGVPQGMDDMDALAERYVRLVLGVGEHDPAYVDAYYGPSRWREEVRAAQKALPDLAREAAVLRGRVEAQPASAGAPAARKAHLLAQIEALQTHAARLQGERLSFEEEARRLYDIVVPPWDSDAHALRLRAIDRLLPSGPGSLEQRYNAYVDRFAVPVQRLEQAMAAAIQAARSRTLAQLSLPAGESFTLALVQGKPWSAYNWYQGGYRSRIEVNTDLPVTAARVLELAIHEGYPGHHVYNVLLEHHLVRGRGWPEFQVYPLFSPQSLIAEGTADFAEDLAFPAPVRLAFLRDVLFPKAGFDAREAERYLAVTTLADGLGLGTVEAARRYRNGLASAEETVRFLQQHVLASEARARQRIAFFDAYGAYIVNYSLGEARVRAYVEARAATEAERWRVFAELLSTPLRPSMLVSS